MDAVPRMLQGMLANLPASGAEGESDYRDGRLRIVGSDRLVCCFDATGLAAHSMAAAASALTAYCRSLGIDPGDLTVDRRLASLWFGQSLVPEGWQLPPMWDDLAGDYRSQDDWIRLHTNAPHHRRRALDVLGCGATREQVRQAVAGVSAKDVESAIVEAGGCAATMRTTCDWHAHPQGAAVLASPLIAWSSHGVADTTSLHISQSRPLSGIRVIDLTRVIAGPVATRFLAAYGADVLRVDPVGLWDDSDNAPEMTLGKRCVGLDLRRDADRDKFAALIARADVLVHGYRPGALEKLGFDDSACRRINRNLVSASLCAYGWTGPWAARRGFDSLVQMSSGIAAAGMAWQHAARPVPLPVQALDHATGYLLAAAVIDALIARHGARQVRSARLSLAKTASLLTDFSGTDTDAHFDACRHEDVGSAVEKTFWGRARRVRFPVTHQFCEAAWSIPAGQLRSTTL